MRLPSVAPAVTRTISIVLAVAAAGILLVTALADRNGGRRPTARPSRPSSPVAESTMPGSIDLPPTAEPTTPHVRTADAKTWLHALAGKWSQDAGKDYFQFQPDGTGQWMAFGQKLWSGKATPRDATTFDLSDRTGQGASYWRVELVNGGKKLFFVGLQKTYRKA
ncbi:hypothetical protein GCM10023196_070160 [Actinoallomurus vinaceus]|uniref:DUF1579 domain-containing protein n=1 Tax=Actinoallomurus vinaceus TaxID=1080074 RepID=A0ABP8UJB1_9ACTN